MLFLNHGVGNALQVLTFSHLIAPMQLFLLVVLLFVLESGYSKHVAIVSERTFHLDLIPGFLDALREAGANISLYVDNNVWKPGGAFGFLEYLNTDIPMYRLTSPPPPYIDAVIFISPEFEPMYVQQFLRSTVAARVAYIIHLGDNAQLPFLLKIRPDALVIACAPHVRDFIARRGLTTNVRWLIPTRPFPNKCLTNETSCFSGFSVQVRCCFARSA